MVRRIFGCAAALALAASLPAAAAAKHKAAARTPEFAVKNKVTLGGEGGWDYLKYDAAGKRLFISRATHVIVVDPVSGKQVGDIANTEGVHGIALAPELGKGFTSNGRSSTVTVFDLKTLKERSRVATAAGPDAILYDPATQRVFTMDGRAGKATAIDAKTEKVVGEVDLGGRPEFAVADGRGKVYINLEDKSKLVEMDSRNLKLLNTWPLGSCENPSGLAMDREHRRLFSGCDNKVMAIVNADSGAVVATLPIGEGVDATRFDSGLGLAFSSNGQDGNLTIIKEESPEKFTVAQNLETELGARTMALDAETHTIYTVTAKFGPPPPGERYHSILPGTFVLITVGRK